jgi:hypothetical protein
MMRRPRLAPHLGLAALLLAQLACNTLLPPRPALAWDTSPTALVLRASNCCGLVPNTFLDNYIPEAQLWGDGRLVWVQQDGLGGERRVLTASLTTAEMQALLETFLDAGFFGWRDLYADYRATDLPTTCLEIHLLSTSKHVCEYFRGAPKAFHRLFDEMAAGAGHANRAVDFVPQRGYLSAFPLPATQPASPANWQWPAEAVGLSLSEAEGGRWVEGAALELAWSITSAHHWNTLVQDGADYYEITLIVPEVSWVKPPTAP